MKICNYLIPCVCPQFLPIQSNGWWLASRSVTRISLPSVVSPRSPLLLSARRCPCSFSINSLHRSGLLLNWRPILPQPSPQGTVAITVWMSWSIFHAWFRRAVLPARRVGVGWTVQSATEGCSWWGNNGRTPLLCLCNWKLEVYIWRLPVKNARLKRPKNSFFI
jgi:hypothetical protein